VLAWPSAVIANAMIVMQTPWSSGCVTCLKYFTYVMINILSYPY